MASDDTSVRINRKPILYLSINIIKLIRVDTVEQSFTCEFVLRGWTSGIKGARMWQSKALSAPVDIDDPRWADGELARPLTLEDYDPRIHLLNAAEIVSWNFSKAYMADEGGEMQFKWRIVGTFLETLEIADFPRDLQLLQIQISTPIPNYVIRASGAELSAMLGKLDELAAIQRKEFDGSGSDLFLSEQDLRQRDEIVAWRRQESRVQRVLLLSPSDEVLLEPAEFAATSGLTDAHRHAILSRHDVLQTNNAQAMTGSWHVQSGVITAAHISSTVASGTNTIRPRVIFACLLLRKPGFYYWNIEVPMAVLTTLTGVVFSLTGDTANQLAIGITLVLTAVAYKLTVASHVPVVSYLTALDHFISGCFLFMILAMLLVVVLPVLVDPDHEIATQRLTRLFGSVWLVLWLLALLSYTHGVRRVYEKRRLAQERFDQTHGGRRSGISLSATAAQHSGNGSSAKQGVKGYQQLET